MGLFIFLLHSIPSSMAQDPVYIVNRDYLNGCAGQEGGNC